MKSTDLGLPIEYKQYHECFHIPANTHHTEEKNKVTTIGRLVARDIFKGEDPIGKFINLGSRAFKVVGVFQDTSGDTEENKLIIPYTTRQQILKGTDVIGNLVADFDDGWIVLAPDGAGDDYIGAEIHYGTR